MRTVDYSWVLNQVASLLGDDPTQIARDLDMRIRGFMARRLKTGWEDYEWPELMRCEERFFAPYYVIGTVYTAGTIVFFEEDAVYYQALTGFTASSTVFDPSSNGVVNSTYWIAAATEYSAAAYDPGTAYATGTQAQYQGTVYQNILGPTTGILPTDTTKWTALVPFERIISLDATGQTAIGTVYGCFATNRNDHPAAREQDWKLVSGGILVRNEASSWVEFRMAAPLLGPLTYSAVAVYAAGSRVYYANSLGVGNFYVAGAGLSAGQTPESTPAKWTLVTLPEFLERYLVQGTYADCLKADGMGSLWAMENDTALGLLGDQKGLIAGVSGQQRRVQVGSR